MYFIDRRKITETIQYMNALLEFYEKKQQWTSFNDLLALERVGANIIESIIDVGNSMIDGFIMRDPGSYDDIIDILVDEKVITADMDQPFKDVIALRKMLVREFMKVDQQEIIAALDANLESLKAFGPRVEHYLVHELGPVSAFIPETNDDK
ncbi:MULTISPECIES: DUF86 domain-containing protein [Planococcus]|uniref:DUF86 domain-containing protein n=1 Tax=Planococcus faecalis TaxID=1598147 RepID=A0ABN4XGB9_9BACL|nr:MULTISPECIES: DUF86 domain-containing protein [Planococcus]AQU78822.1 hypothetical protein AJGP001_05820 [Planococcus faecalis]MDJ0332070.1 DUF86 domain-containing protein [Planococcus sp. S3-L1]OHX52904.1 hypothetical protein BB777_11290 [Planococcus faecalis]